MSIVKQALERLTIWDFEDLARIEGATSRRDGLYSSPFRQDRKPSFSVFKNGQAFKDHAQPLYEGTVWHYVSFALFGHVVTKDQKAEYKNLCETLVRRAGLPWEDSKPLTAAEKKAWAKQRRAQAAAAAERVLQQRAAALAMPAQGKPLEPCPPVVKSRWEEGRHAIVDWIDRLAAARGWPGSWVEHMIDADMLSLPQLGTSRGVAFKVEAPERQQGKVVLKMVGYHQKIKQPDSAYWVYQPGNGQIPALPFVVGVVATKPRWVIVTEGQWDALTLWGALGGFDDSSDTALPLIIFGLRGAQGVDPFLAYYGALLREWRIEIALMPDTDTAGQSWLVNRSEGKRCLAERLAHLTGTACRVVKLPSSTGTDFNDFYRARQPSRAAVQTLALGRLNTR